MCKVRRGNFFLETLSTTFRRSASITTAGGATSEITTQGTEPGVPNLISTTVGGTDRFALTSGEDNAGIPLTMPIGIPRLRWDNGHTFLHAVGMGSNSTYLNALVKAGRIPSRVWSIFWGRMWTTAAPMDGALVLGGYDSEKVTGKNYTMPLDYSETSGCWTGMKVTVSDLIVNFANGDEQSVMPQNTAVQCCIVPQRQLLFEGPEVVVNGFMNATGMESVDVSFGLHIYARVINSTTP